MAVTADYLLDEDSGNESSSEEVYCPGLSDPSSGDQVEEGYDRTDETLQPSVALSEEAQLLLRRASRSLAKRRRASRFIVAPLYRQLKSLRNFVPYSTPAKESCVVADALDYLKRMKQEIEDLHGLVAEHPYGSGPQDAFPSIVNITSVEQRLVVHVSCQMRPGLMSALMVVLEESGLVLDDVNASCNTHLTFDASSSQKGIEAVDKKALRRALLQTMFKQQRYGVVE